MTSRASRRSASGMWLEMRSMAVNRESGERALAQLRAVDDAYPLIGELGVAGGGVHHGRCRGQGGQARQPGSVLQVGNG